MKIALKTLLSLTEPLVTCLGCQWVFFVSHQWTRVDCVQMTEKARSPGGLGMRQGRGWESGGGAGPCFHQGDTPQPSGPPRKCCWALARGSAQGQTHARAPMASWPISQPVFLSPCPERKVAADCFLLVYIALQWILFLHFFLFSGSFQKPHQGKRADQRGRGRNSS